MNEVRKSHERSAPSAAPTYDRTPVDCLISELHEMVLFGWMTKEGFEQRVAQFNEEVGAPIGYRNLPAQPVERTSAGVCGMHGVFVGMGCPKCVTQPKGLSNG